MLMIAPTVFLPTYAQSVLGLSPTAAGFVLSAMTLSWPVSAALSNRVYLRIGFRQSAIVGMSLAALILFAFPLLPYPGAAWQPALIMLLLGGALGLFQLPLIVGVQSSVGWAERGTATGSILFCRQVGQSVGAALFGAAANATVAARLADAPDSLGGDLPDDLDSVSRALEHPGELSAEAADYLRRTVDDSVDHVYLGAALAAVLTVLALLLLAPRVFPTHVDDPTTPATDSPAPSGTPAATATSAASDVPAASATSAASEAPATSEAPAALNTSVALDAPDGPEPPADGPTGGPTGEPTSGSASGGPRGDAR